MIVLAIETSCDETAVAIVDDRKNILSNLIISQIDIHKEFGGVVPEIAARSHIDVIEELLKKALNEASLNLKEIDGIAVTSGPGLIGGLIVGVMFAKSLSLVLKKPLIAINHLEGHILTPFLTSDLEFPFLTLLVSGGHCQILHASQFGQYQLIGQTIDDALGECFDKVAQMIGEDYPGGPKIESLAKSGNENRFKLPRPLVIGDLEKKNIYNFSFSGLKTSIRRLIEKLTQEPYSKQSCDLLSTQDKVDICASFQKTVSDVIINRLNNVISGFAFEDNNNKTTRLVLSGGVAANKYINNRLQSWCDENEMTLYSPDLKLCTDNAAMIAWAGIKRLKNDYISDLNFKPRAKWPLSQNS